MDTADRPTPASGSLLHVGAGTGQRLAALLDRGPARLVLVEPDKDRAAALERAVAGRPGVEVHRVALGPQGGRGRLYRTNFAELDGLCRPNARMLEVFPGFRIEREEEIDVLTPADFLERLGALPDPVDLVLEAPGSEQDILTGLKEAGLLARIERIELQCGAVPLYDGAAGRPRIEAWLAAEGLTLAAVDEADPDRPVLTFTVDPRDRALKAAGMRLAEIETALADREAALIAERAAAADLAAEAAQAAQRDAAAQALRLATLQAEAADLRAEAAALQEQVHGQQAEIAAQETALAAAREERDAVTAEAAAARSVLVRERDALWKERDEARGQRDALKAEVAALRAEHQREREALSTERDEARKERDELRAVRQDLAAKAAAQEAALAEIRAARDAREAERDEARKEIRALEARVRDHETRLGLAREEFLRSEGQIALIKDLVLREGGL